MAKFVLIALNSPIAGEGVEVKYNKWYDEVHKPDLMSVDGARSVRRFKIEAQNRVDKQYVCVTEFEADSVEAIRKGLGEKASTITDLMDRSTSMFVLAREITK